MKLKILNVLTVGVITLAVVTPGLIVFNVVWGQHLELVKTQNLSCQTTNINQDSESLSSLSLQQKSINYLQSPAQDKLSPHNFFVQLHTIVEESKFFTILQWIVFSTPICIGLGIIAYDRYLVYRSAVFKAQVEMLERLWEQSIEQ